MVRATGFFLHFLVAVCFAVCFAAVGYAQAPTVALVRSIFTINNVPVDVTARSAAAARERAIGQARRLAFSSIYKKLVAQEDLALEPALTNAELTDLVRAIDVTDERTSETRYIAALSVSFDPEKLSTLLQRLNVTFTDSETPPISLVPVAHYGGLDLLNSPDNVWRLAWERSPIRAASLVQYVLPDDSIGYQRRISASSARDATPEALIDLITYQEARDILLAFASIRLDLVTGRYESTFEIRRGPGQGAFMDFKLLQQDAETPQQMLERAIARIDAELSALWKRQLLVEFSRARTVSITATFETPQQWRTIRSAFTSSRRLRNLRIPSLSLGQADATARFFGSFDALEESFALRGLRIAEDDLNQWSVRPMTEMEAQVFGTSAVGAQTQFVDPLEDQTRAQAENAASDPTVDNDPLTDIDIPPWELGPGGGLKEEPAP